MFDNPLFFLILISVLSAISDWLGKRRKAARLQEMERAGELEVDDTSSPEAALREERRRSVREQEEDWEERLRRMLGADDEPPPVREQPQPTTHTQPASVFEAEPPPPPVFVGETRAPQQAVPQTASPAIQARLANTEVSLSESAPAMQMRRVKSARRSPVINFRSKDAIRKSIVASVVLGPPKGSGEESDLIRL